MLMSYLALLIPMLVTHARSPLLRSYLELVKVKTMEGKFKEAQHYQWLADQLTKTTKKPTKIPAPAGDGPFAQCQFRDLEMFCLSRTWPAKYYNKTKGYQISKARCFPQNVRHLGLGCLVSERAIQQAYLGSKSESTYLIKKNALATKCIRCIDTIKTECKMCGSSNKIMQVTHGVLHAMPSAGCPNKCLPKLVQEFRRKVQRVLNRAIEAASAPPTSPVINSMMSFPTPMIVLPTPSKVARVRQIHIVKSPHKIARTPSPTLSPAAAQFGIVASRASTSPASNSGAGGSSSVGATAFSGATYASKRYEFQQFQHVPSSSPTFSPTLPPASATRYGIMAQQPMVLQTAKRIAYNIWGDFQCVTWIAAEPQRCSAGNYKFNCAKACASVAALATPTLLPTLPPTPPPSTAHQPPCKCLTVTGASQGIAAAGSLGCSGRYHLLDGFQEGERPVYSMSDSAFSLYYHAVLKSWVVSKVLHHFPLCIGSRSRAKQPQLVRQWSLGTEFGLQTSTDASVAVSCGCAARPREEVLNDHQLNYQLGKARAQYGEAESQAVQDERTASREDGWVDRTIEKERLVLAKSEAGLDDTALAQLMDDSLSKLQHAALEEVSKKKVQAMSKVDTQLKASSAFLTQEGASLTITHGGA